MKIEMLLNRFLLLRFDISRLLLQHNQQLHQTLLPFSFSLTFSFRESLQYLSGRLGSFFVENLFKQRPQLVQSPLKVFLGLQVFNGVFFLLEDVVVLTKLLVWRKVVQIELR